MDLRKVDSAQGGSEYLFEIDKQSTDLDLARTEIKLRKRKDPGILKAIGKIVGDILSVFLEGLWPLFAGMLLVVLIVAAVTNVMARRTQDKEI